MERRVELISLSSLVLLSVEGNRFASVTSRFNAYDIFSSTGDAFAVRAASGLARSLPWPLLPFVRSLPFSFLVVKSRRDRTRRHELLWIWKCWRGSVSVCCCESTSLRSSSAFVSDSSPFVSPFSVHDEHLHPFLTFPHPHRSFDLTYRRSLQSLLLAERRRRLPSRRSRSFER